MTSYLLLRNNKESGPYSLNELVGKGLKPYDLVWVNGKSAAWRYPSEIPELSQYAPAVEEQPFDRFYKKNIEEKPIEAGNSIQSNTAQKDIQPKEETPVQQIQPTQPAFVPKKSVFVTMPGQKQSLPAEASAKAEGVGSGQSSVGSSQSSVNGQGYSGQNNKNTEQPKKQQQSVNDQYEQYQQYQPQVNNSTADDASHLSQTITIKENPVAAEIKYSQSLDDIKEMYVRTLQQRKQRLLNKSMLLKLGKNAAIILAIAGVGAIIGFSIKTKSPKSDIVNATSVQPSITNPAVANVPDTTAEKLLLQQQEVLSVPVENDTKMPATQNQQEQIFPEEKQKPATPGQENDYDEPVQKEQPIAKAMMKKEPEQKREPVISPTYPGADVNVRGERTRTVREGDDASGYNGNAGNEIETAPVTPKEETRAAMKKATGSSGPLARQVAVSSNAYQIVAFGGIRNLHLTVTNNSKYVLDNVIVELNYLKPSELPLKTQNIEFRGISPGGAMTIRIPDTNRGVKISYRILNILSVQSQKESAGL